MHLSGKFVHFSIEATKRNGGRQGKLTVIRLKQPFLMWNIFLKELFLCCNLQQTKKPWAMLERWNEHGNFLKSDSYLPSHSVKLSNPGTNALTAFRANRVEL